MKQLFFTLICVTLLTGCVQPGLYTWRSYEPLVYAMYSSPDDATPELQIIHLEEDIQKARSKDQKLPPGFYAHLGYLYFQQGDLELAKRAFETEKQAFPESAVLMDRMINNMTPQS